MTTLKITHIEIPAAVMGPENPLPKLRNIAQVQSPVAVDESVPEHERTHLGYGLEYGSESTCLPYSVQDGYTRNRAPRSFKVAILENEFLRATVLLEFGGRLWSLFHKPTQKELLCLNPVFQPANLAIRNAWYSGGVEWNCGVRGHTPFTCAPLFAAEVQSPEGWPVLRLWEFERIRAVPFQIDFLLPPGSPWLMVRVGLSNPHAQTIPLYWWSNIAVTQTPDVRVLAPADSALNFPYQGALCRVPVPMHEGFDLTYATRNVCSADYFFSIPEHQRPWVAAVKGDGTGFVQTSTQALRGRKLFVWGNSQGGSQWQKFLTEGDEQYLEIQAGVARSQYESFPMPPHSQLEWMEAYGAISTDPALIHGADWTAATSEVDRTIAQLLPAQKLEEFLQSTQALFQQPPDRLIQKGSGWGALEQLRREKANEASLAPHKGIDFNEDSLTAEQAPWAALLRTGKFPDDGQHQAWMVQPEWVELLEDSGDDHWLAWLHRGVMRYHQDDLPGAKSAWEQSLKGNRSPWALRNLAVLATREGRACEASSLLMEARALVPDLIPLTVECLVALLDAAQITMALALFDQIPASVAQAGRVRYLHARAALEAGDFSLTEALLSSDLVVADLREGETMLSDLWYELKARQMAQYAASEVTEEIRRHTRTLLPPAHLDFRQSAALPKSRDLAG